VVMETTGLGIEIQAADIGSGWRHWMNGGSRVKNSKMQQARGRPEGRGGAGATIVVWGCAIRVGP
jgi:hypothetical protein